MKRGKRDMVFALGVDVKVRRVGLMDVGFVIFAVVVVRGIARSVVRRVCI